MANRLALFRSIGLTMFVFGLLIWLYAVLIQITHPDWLAEQLSHVEFPPFNSRIDELGIIAFAIAVVGFLIWQLSKST